MGNFNRGNKGGRDFKRGGGSSERPMMHQAICADCGKSCSVPFRPSGDKPVYCSDCFGKKDGSKNNRFEKRDSGRPSFGASNFGDRKMFKASCDNCHKECEVPFRPTGEKPVFCADCFSKVGKDKIVSRPSSVSADQYSKQFEALNNKLDSILKLLAPEKAVEKKVEKKPEIKIEKKIEKKVEVKVVKKAVKKPVVKKKK